MERRVVDEDDEDDEEGGTVAAAISLRTKNELPEPDIVIPSIAEVGPDEQLEKVGEIMNIVNNVVVVKGEPSSTHRASEHALDSETLLVYEDRKVLGYVSSALPPLWLTPRPFSQIHETFGPTYQPMYQVKFNSAHPLDSNEARVSRPVFHVPARSKYVFVAELTKLRGSDASNVHDEEPAEYEVEFSDDEAEAAYKAKLRERFVAYTFPCAGLTPRVPQTTFVTRTQRPRVARTHARPRPGYILRMEPVCRARRVRHGSELWRESIAPNTTTIR